MHSPDMLQQTELVTYLYLATVVAVAIELLHSILTALLECSLQRLHEVADFPRPYLSRFTQGIAESAHSLTAVHRFTTAVHSQSVNVCSSNLCHLFRLIFGSR